MAPKRGAGKRTGSPSPKKARSVVPEKLKAVVKALKDEELCEVPGPASNRAMLIEAVGHVLKTVVEERHSYQSSVATMIGDILKASQASWQKKVNDAGAGVASAEAEKEAAEATVKAAKDALEAQKEVINAKKEALTSAKQTVQESKENVAAATKEFKGHDAAQSEKIEEKADLDKVYSDCFLALKSPPAEEEKPLDGRAKNSAVSKITSALKKLKAEPSLAQAVDPAIRKAAAERGSFDAMAVDGVDAFLKAKIAEMQGEVDGGERAKAEKEKAKMAAEAMLEAASTKEKDAKDALKAAEDEKTSKSGALDDAKKILSEKTDAVSEAKVKHDSEKEGLDEVIGSMEAYTFLLERKAPVPEPEEPKPSSNID